MTTDDIILHIFCLVDDSLPEIPRHSQANLYPSELVTIGILFPTKPLVFHALLSRRCSRSSTAYLAYRCVTIRRSASHRTTPRRCQSCC